MGEEPSESLLGRGQPLMLSGRAVYLSASLEGFNPSTLVSWKGEGQLVVCRLGAMTVKLCLHCHGFGQEEGIDSSAFVLVGLILFSSIGDQA